MSKLKTTALALMVALTGTASAGNFVPQILNEQLNWSPVFSNLNLYAKWVGGDVRGTSAAIGNNLISESQGTIVWLNKQVQLADVGADLNAKLKGVHGEVDLQAVGICNNAALTSSESNYAYGRNDQRCNTLDPYANLNVAAFSVGGDVTLSAAAIGNNLNIDSVAAFGDFGSFQANASAVYANVNATLVDVGGSVSASAVAIGNNASITQRFTKP